MKFAQYLNDTQTPEWKKAYIDYRGLKKHITAVRRVQQGEESDSSSPHASGSDTPDAQPATPTPSINSGFRDGGLESKHIKGQPAPANVIQDSSTLHRKTASKAENIGHSTGVQNHGMELPRRMSVFGRSRSFSVRGGLSGISSLPSGDKLKPMPIHELMNRLSPQEIAFFSLLDAQLDKVEAFYTTREKEMEERGEKLQEQLRELNEHRQLYLAVHAKVPWAAALAAAFRPTRRQLKVTRTISLSEDNAKTVSDSVFNRLRNAMKAFTLPASRAQSRCTEDAKLGLSPPDADKVSERGIRSVKDGTHSPPPPSPSSPISPSFGPDADNYLYAKRKLKKAVIEHYRGLELLHNYRVLNLTGFRKALKKFEKVTRLPVQDQYMSDKVEKSDLASDRKLQEMMKEMENLYANAFVHGNKKKAMKRLRGGTRIKSHHFSTWRSGLLMGLAVPALISGFVHAFNEDAMEEIHGWEALMMVYGILVIPTLFATLVGLNLLVWARSRINYVFIFELNVNTALDYREYFEIPTILLCGLCYAFWLSFAQIGAPAVSPSIWPLAWLGAVAIMILNPLPIYFRSSRYWLSRVVGKLLLSGTRRVEFTDFWLGDQFCSLVFTFSNIYFFGCVYAGGFSSDWATCGPESKYWPVVYVLAVLPFLIRLVQSIKRYFDSGLVTHLINGGKYGSGIVAYLFYTLWRHHGTYRHGPLFVLYCLAITFYSVYSVTWDYLMDWSVLQIHSSNYLLRPDLVYSNHIPLYYCAIVSNTILRFTWVIYIPSRGPDMFLRTFIVALFEMLRRIQWNFYRLENEHLGNMDQYRVTREVPLPYLFDDPHREDDRDDDEDGKRR